MGCTEEDSHNLLFIYCHLTDRNKYGHGRGLEERMGMVRDMKETVLDILGAKL